MNPPDTSHGALENLPALPRDEDGPVFAEPWQAQAFAMAVRLCDQGYFSPTEWAEALGGELREAARRGQPDDGSHYYHHWVAALEKLAVSKQLVADAELVDCRNAWADAYSSTPHGLPVELHSGGRS